MWERIKNSRVLYAIFAVLAAIGCWLYVDGQNTDASVTISNIPVSYIGEDRLEAQGLLIQSEVQTINIRVQGPRSTITKLNRDNVIITAAVGDITDSGVYKLDCSINLPSAVTSRSPSPVRIVSRSASAIDVTVVQMVSKRVEIVPIFTGTVAENHFWDEDSFVLQQHELEISGEESVVDQVSYAKVELSETGLETTWTGWLNVTLCSADGEEIQSDKLTMETSAVSVAFYVECEKELPLKVTLVSGGGATEEDADCRIQPSSIVVTGQEIVLESIDELNLGTVNLDQIVSSEDYEFEIQLPSGLSSREKESTTAKVHVSIEGLDTRFITTSNINLIHLPEENDLEYQCSPLQVRVRGKSEAFDLLMSDDIQVTLDMDGISISEGETVTVPAKVEITGFAELGALGNYSVDVTAVTNNPEHESTQTDVLSVPPQGMDEMP